MTPSPEALTWQRRADAWAQQSEVEPYTGGGGGQAIEPANRWSDVASTGRPAFPADGVGWRTQTSEWRATGARWRQTTEWRSSTGSHVWRSTTEAWEGGEGEGQSPAQAQSPDRPTISGTAWPTPALESGRESSREISSSWSETPSWQRDADPPGRAATTPVEQTWSSSSATPSWQQPSAPTPSWQQSAQTPSWQQPQQPPAPTPSWQQPAAPTPSWQQQPQQQRPADPWSTSTQTGGARSAESAAPSSSWDTGRRSPGENTTDVAGWDRSDGPGWQAGPRDDGRHFVREDDRAAWRRADDEWSTRRGRRRAPEPEVQPSGGSGWSSPAEGDEWSGHHDTGNIYAAGSPMADPGPPAPSWGSRSVRRDYEPDEAPRRGPAPDQSAAYGERGGQTPIQYGVRPVSSRRAAPDDRRAAPEEPPPGPGGPIGTGTASGGLPERQRGDGRRGRKPQRYNANPTNWREDTSSWDADEDSSNWTRDPDTGQWSRGDEDPRVLAWRAEAARREQMKQGETALPAEPGGPAGWDGGGRRGRRDDEATGPVGGMPGGPLPPAGMPDGPGARPRSAMPDSPAARQRSAMPAPRSAMPASPPAGGGWSNAGAMPGPATPRSAMPGGAPWNGADQPDPAASGRFRAEQQYGSGPYPAQRGASESYGAADPYAAAGSYGAGSAGGGSFGGADPYGNDNGGRRRAPEPEPEAWPGRQARRDDDYAAESWRQGPMPPRPRELPAGQSDWSEPGYGAQRELPAGRRAEERDPRQGGYGAPEPDGWAVREQRQQPGYGAPEPDRGPRQGGYGAPRQNGYDDTYGAPQPDRGGYAGQGWSDTRRVNGARELPPGNPSREPSYGMRELPAAPRKPAYGGQRELPGGPSPQPSQAAWSDQDPPGFEAETDRYGNPRRRDDRDDPPFGGGGGREPGDRRAPGAYDGVSADGGNGQVSGGNGAANGFGGYRREADPATGPGPGGDWRAELNGGGSAAAPVSGASGYRAAATPGGDWRADLNGGGGAAAGAAAPVAGYRATAAAGPDWRAEMGGAPAAGAAPTTITTAVPPAGDWRAEMNGTVTGSAPVSGAAGAGYRPAADPGADWRADLNGTAAAPASGAAGYRAAAGPDWRTDMSTAPTSGAAPAAVAPVSGAAGYRAAPGSAPEVGADWRRELAAPGDGDPQRFSTSDFPPFQPSGSAAVANGSNLALSATSVISTAGAGAAPASIGSPGSVEEDTSWPPRRGVSSALFENTGSYERRPVSSGLLSGQQNDLLDPGDEDEAEKSNSPLAAVGYTIGWYGVPVVLFVIGILLVNTGQRAHALQTLANAAPEFGISLGLSIVVAFGLRFATTAWKSASVGLAAAVVGGGLATVLASAITGNSLS
ncbi:hypothetical protein [Actinoplanes sp. L3-i22]|uniref:hypothetical protein n=1 Tax=Actinoplanes sp. L3-i22 TaxID=2836373 RepID=UPI001C84D21E|nr:hypothetical protein [Actinoplanes sp. L3-i22]